MGNNPYFLLHLFSLLFTIPFVDSSFYSIYLRKTSFAQGYRYPNRHKFFNVGGEYGTVCVDAAFLGRRI